MERETVILCVVLIDLMQLLFNVVTFKFGKCCHHAVYHLKTSCPEMFAQHLLMLETTNVYSVEKVPSNATN